jgi:hypothetical protein
MSKERLIRFNPGLKRTMGEFFGKWRKAASRRGVPETSIRLIRKEWQDGNLSLIIKSEPKPKYEVVPKKVELAPGDNIDEVMEEIARSWGCPDVNDSQYFLVERHGTGRYSHLGHYTKIPCQRANTGITPCLCVRLGKKGKYLHIEEHSYGTCERWGKTGFPRWNI